LLLPLFSPLPFSCHPSPQAEDLLLPLSLPLRGAGAQAERPKGEAADFIAFIFVAYFFPSFLAQKSHVKSQNHLSHSNEIE